MSPSLPERLRKALSPGRLVQALFPDRLGIALYPDRLVLTRMSGDFGRGVKHKEIVPFAPAAQGVANWRPAVDALAATLAAGTPANAEVTLVLSSHFVRYVLVPASDALGSREEEQAFARHCFERVYGSDSGDWTLKSSQADPTQARLACAVEQPLVEALANCLAGLNARYRSLQPHLMVSFNRVRTLIGALPAWLAVVEPGLICLGLLRKGQWQSVCAFKVGPDWLQELPALIAREDCLVESDSACERVLVVAPDAPGAKLPQTDQWRFETLLPASVAGLDPGRDAAHCIALGA